MNPHLPPSRAGFTLVELVLAIVVIALLAASAVPAFRTLTAVRQGAAASELRRLLQSVRATAVSTGRPSGLACSATSTLTKVRIEDPGDAPSTLTTPLGEAFEEVSLPSQFPGVSLTLARTGLGDTGAVTFWFAEDGTPHSRNSSGVELPAWNADGLITLSGGAEIVIRRVSGAID